MAVDRIKHTKPASQRTFLDELEPIPYEITEEELSSMDPRMKKVLFGIGEQEEEAPEPEAEEAAEVAGESVEDKPEIEKAELEESFDPVSVADFPQREGRSVTVIFPVLEGFEEAENVARAAAEHREVEAEGQTWHAARFGMAEAAELKHLNELLGEREDVVVLVNGLRPPYARSLWLPMMYIFAGEE
jgi:hypothetical protein